MKISCCWMYAIGKYGFPPEINNMKKAIGEMAQMGFKYIELEGLGYENLKAVYDNRQILKEECLRNNVKVVNFAIIISQALSTDPDELKEGIKYFEMGVKTASYLGSERVWIDSYMPPVIIKEGKSYIENLDFGKQIYAKLLPDFTWKAFWEKYTKNIEKCNQICKDHGVELLIEPRVGEVLSNSDALLRIFNAVDDDNLGAILDIAHQYAQKEILPIAIAKLNEKIKYVHVADNDGRDNHHYVIGNGSVDWDEIFITLKSIGYNSYYAIDLEKVPNLTNAFLKSKRILEEYAQKYDL
ncbi:MAG: sugar phosphate isomerase/epimerase [Atribacterota bacterium]|nr:sugar phosphate isomerase/epimerase [Atribacterota bacterium]MDD4895195.1 sugar phosphate isomerase/epimerase [Atribacterota bacterium]MDD5637782.1 sugar phosphate isomerase/epimerase [Atribacterota bacterium]